MRRRLLCLGASSFALTLAIAACVGDESPVTAGPTPGVDGGGTDGGGADAPAAKPTLDVTAPKSVSLGAQASATLEVTIVRGGSLVGPIKVAPVGLPGGVTAEPITIAADQTRGALTLTSSSAPTFGITTASVSAEAMDASTSAKANVEVVVRGAVASLDTSFNGSGIVTDANLIIAGAGIQSDGKIVFGGSARSAVAFPENFAASRLGPDGKIDTTFGVNGVAKVQLGSSDPGFAAVRSVAVDANDAILLGGSASRQRMGVVKFDKNGALDPTLGTKGIAPAESRGVRVFSRGPHVFVLGFARAIIGGPPAVGRLVASGFDATFGNGGLAADPNNAHYVSVYDALVMSDGKFVIAGVTGPIGGDEVAVVRRYNADGSSDATFGTDGAYTYDQVDTREGIDALTAIDGGRVLAAGHQGQTGAPFLHAILPNGKADGSFGAPLAPQGDANTNVTITTMTTDAEGRILLAGYGTLNGSSRPFLWRRTKNGAPDASFNGGSALFFTQSFFDSDSLPMHMSIDKYGRALLCTSRVVARIWL